MSFKFSYRTFRNYLFRERPYFAHLAVTHRCNLKCRFCQIQEEPFEELDYEGMKRVIDVLDRMGVAIISVSGGGEPLLRKDCLDIIDYAAVKGLYTKLTSNGTLAIKRYTELLESNVKEIGISLDDVEGDDLPYSHTSPKILRTIQYLNHNLPDDKRLTLNITVSQINKNRVNRIVDYCTREFPNARIWLNPVVVGSGKLRKNDQEKVNPDYLRHVDSPTLLSTKFFREGAEEQFRKQKFDWGCLAGQFFFDIKPNGDFWMCQDYPANTPLNILDPDFFEKYRTIDFNYRKECSGCTYSCYFVTQKFFEMRNWPQMAELWWKAVTRPDERCRHVAIKYGWLPGLLYFCRARLHQPASKPTEAIPLAHKKS